MLRALNIEGGNGLPTGRYEGRLTVMTDLDDEASAFVHVLSRERGLSYREACGLVVEAGLQALGL